MNFYPIRISKRPPSTHLIIKIIIITIQFNSIQVIDMQDNSGGPIKKPAQKHKYTGTKQLHRQKQKQR
jgi:hypothetical protein